MAEKTAKVKTKPKAEDAPAEAAPGAMALKDIPGLVADVELTDNTRMVGIVSPYRGEIWAQIRKYVESNAYTGLTQSGVALKKDAWEAFETIMKALPDGEALEKETGLEKEWGRVEKSRTSKVIIRTLKDQGTSPGLKVDIREWVEGGKYTGWTKKGVRFGAEHLILLRPLIAKVTETVGKTPALPKKEGEKS